MFNNNQKKARQPLTEKIAATPLVIKIVYILLLIAFVAVATYGLLVFWFGIESKKGIGGGMQNIQETKRESASNIVFQRIDSWGPCPDPGTCKATTTLYANGDVYSSEEGQVVARIGDRQVDIIKESIDRFIAEGMNCTLKEAMDIGVRYRFEAPDGSLARIPQGGFFNGAGCRELQQIESIISRE